MISFVSMPAGPAGVPMVVPNGVARAIAGGNGGDFLPISGAALSTVIESNIVTLSKVGSAATLTIVGGEYSKNGGPYSTAIASVKDGDTLRLRVTSSGSKGTATSAVVTIGGLSRTFTVTTTEASVTPTPTPTPGQTDNIIVVNRLAYPNDSQSLNSTNTARREHYASSQGAITNLRPQFIWNFLNSGGVTGGGAAASLKHSLEYPEGVIHPVTWNGVRELVTAANANYMADVVIDSRTIESGNPQPLEIPPSAKHWERTTYVSSASKAFPTLSYPASVSALGVSDGKISGDYSDGGVIPADTNSTVSWGMTSMKGTIKTANAKAAIIYGDSLTVGQGDSSGASAKGSVGMVSRKIDEVYPSVVIARGGYYASQFATIISGVAFPNFIAQLGATHAIVQAGLNDLSLGSRTAAQVMASRKTIHDTTAARIPGIISVHTTITPRVTSASGNYSSVADQSPKTDGNMADLTTLNGLIRAEPAQTPGSLVMDYADAAMSARDSNVFSGPFPPVADGTHLLTAKVVAVAAAVSMPF